MSAVYTLERGVKLPQTTQLSNVQMHVKLHCLSTPLKFSGSFNFNLPAANGRNS